MYYLLLSLFLTLSWGRSHEINVPEVSVVYDVSDNNILEEKEFFKFYSILGEYMDYISGTPVTISDGKKEKHGFIPNQNQESHAYSAKSRRLADDHSVQNISKKKYKMFKAFDALFEFGLPSSSEKSQIQRPLYQENVPDIKVVHEKHITLPSKSDLQWVPLDHTVNNTWNRVDNRRHREVEVGYDSDYNGKENLKHHPGQHGKSISNQDITIESKDVPRVYFQRPHVGKEYTSVGTPFS